MRLFLLAVIFLPITCFSQVDSTYIGFYDLRLGVKTYLARDFVFLTQTIEGDKDITYMPNNPVKIGGAFSVNNSVLSFGYGYGFDFMRDKTKGRTKSLDFQYHNYGRKFVFDAYIQQYTGFYSEDEDGKVLNVFPKMKINQYAVHGHYIFNNRRYTYRAAFNQSERQLRSVGSFLLGGGVYYTDIRSDGSFLYNNKSYFRRYQAGASVGYAYSWVLGRHWLLSASGTLGINFGNENISDFENKIEIYPSVFPRISASYSNKSWAIHFSYLNNVLFNAASRDNSLAISSGSFQLSFNKRFHLPDRKIFKIFDIL